MARIRLQLVHIPFLTRLFRQQTVQNGIKWRFQTVLVRLQPVQVRFVTSSISFSLRPLSSITRPPHRPTDRSTRPQYVLIPSSLRSDRNCAHVLIRLIKTQHYSASPNSSLTLQASNKYPSMPPSMPLKNNRRKRKNAAPSP